MISFCSFVLLLSGSESRESQDAAPQRCRPAVTALPQYFLFSVLLHRRDGNAASPLKQASHFLLSRPTEQDFHSLLEKDSTMYRVSAVLELPYFQGFSKGKIIIAHQQFIHFLKLIFSKQTKRTEKGGEHNTKS